ncbi:hypothetical protein CANARDRAFT_27834 [[Candida] arabinofermentans NRRL YB-2248]|uniref:LAA1-like C-terminal TPR repeats domain-containing protein n=1 Tax=[Candida] arabinofermentans NRRL YB-2248 TaxID=983967 RepID=A0A1E4T1W0_9ASCO|nr:hypothetical protein CANARDRAFT_27834 [[Candida] arabinofermentans NRRL YB-2248]
MDRDRFNFTEFKPKLPVNNDLESANEAQSALATYLTDIHIELESNQDEVTNDELSFLIEQLDQLIDHFTQSYSDAIDVHQLSVDVNRLLAKVYCLVLSYMLRRAHEKFSISLIDITTKMVNILSFNTKKINIKTNWFSSLKHFAVIFLQGIFTKFNGFLNSFKNPVLTGMYKYLMKCHDYYNISIETGVFKANYFTDQIILIDIILANDNSSNTLDDKLFGRLLKLNKAVTQKNSSNDYIYPLLSVVHSYNFLISLLKSDRFISSITVKKMVVKYDHYLTTIAPYINDLISVMDTDYKKLRLSISKNLSDLLVFNYIVYGINVGESEKSFESIISLLLLNYMKESSVMEIKTGLIEALIQFFSKMNLYHKTNSVSTGFRSGINFVSLKIFDALNVIFYQVFGQGALSTPIKPNSKEDPPSLITNSSSLSEAALVLNHLEILYSFLIREIDCDINKLIVLGKVILGDTTDTNIIKFPSLTEAIPTPEHDAENQWYIITTLKLVQLLVVDLDQYILSQQDGITDSHEDLATQISFRLFQLCKHKNFKIRISAVETLVDLLKIKPELSYNILNSSFTTLVTSFDDDQANKSFIFNENHGFAFLISSILSTCSKDYINSDFVLKVFSITTNFLKKFNSTVITSNLFGSGNSNYISNFNYEKQLISWIMLMGLFNFATDSSGSSNNNFFLLESSQFINIWKNLLAHSMPSNFVQFETDQEGNSRVTNMNEIMKLVEIKNHSLVCLLSYITYLSSTRSSSALHTHESNSKSSLLTPEIARQLNQIINKSFTFVNNLRAQIGNVVTIPSVLDVSIKMNKLRILQNFIKLLPYLNIRNEINSSLLVEAVHNFSSSKLYDYEPEGSQLSKKSQKKKKDLNEIPEYQIYKVGDGLNFGLTSKISMFSVEELLVKSTGLKGLLLQQNKAETDIDVKPLQGLFSIESPFVKSNFAPVTVFDDPLEAMCFETIQHSYLNDYLMFLFNGSSEIGYTDNRKYPVNAETMIIDISIEIFSISFPYMSPKVQQSIIETIRTSIFYKSKESKDSRANNVVTDSNTPGEILRKRAITINSSVAIHGALSYMNNHNSQMQHSKITSSLKLSKTICNLLIETLRNIDYHDSFISTLSTESIGLSCSLVDENRESVLANQVARIDRSIRETTEPSSRSFDCQALAKIAQYSNLMNSSQILQVLFTLLADPHPMVYAAAMDSLTTLISSQPQVELSGRLLSIVLSSLESVWLSDSYGIYSPVTVASNMNYSSYSNSTVVLAKFVRVIVNTAGPMIKLWEDKHKTILRNLIFNLMNTVTNDFELVARELLKALEELVVFDKDFIPIAKYTQFIKFILVNNFKVGVVTNSSSSLPIDDEDNDTTSAIFPNTTSDINWKLALDSLYQLLKLHPDSTEILDDEMKALLWISLEYESENVSMISIFKNWLEHSASKKLDDRFFWFDKLLAYFNMPKLKLYESLFAVYKKRINNGGMFFSNSKFGNSKISRATDTTSSQSSSRPEGSQTTMTLNDEVETFTNGGDDVGLKSDNAIDPPAAKDESKEDGNKIILDDNKLVQLMVLESEPTNWRFKLTIIELLIQLLNFTHDDSKLKLYLSTKIPEFVRIAFVSSSSRLIKLRIASLTLLGDIIAIYGDMTDPLYPEVSILDQQQAQIITAIVPAFNRDSTIELAGAAMVLASKLVSSSITHISKMSRVVKILTSSLESFVTMNQAMNDGSGSDKVQQILKVGDISVLTQKSQNKIKVHILQAWARIKIHSKNGDLELKQLVDKYSVILVPLWLYSLRDFAMMKYGSDFLIGNSDDVEIPTYEECWTDFVEAIGIVVEEDPGQFAELLGEGDDLGNFFFILFAQCIEHLIKVSSKQNAYMTAKDAKILESLNRLLKVDGGIEILFRDSIFIEFIDLLDRLVAISDPSFKTGIVELSMNVFEQYFKSSSSGKTSDQLHADVDKLFELLRINMLSIIRVLPFIRDREINVDKLSPLNGVDLVLLKKSYDSIIEMIGYLPEVIRVDFYSCILYSFSFVYEFNNQEIIAILLPSLKRTIASLNSIVGNSQTLTTFYSTIKPYLNPENNSSLLTVIIAITTITNLKLSKQDCEQVADFIVQGLTSKDTTLIAFSTQAVKSLIKHNNEGDNGGILIELIPKLITLLTTEDVELKEPRLILEIMTTLTKSLSTDEEIVSSMKMTVPILVWFNDSENGKYSQYVHGKLLELIKFSPLNFKSYIDTSCGDAQKSAIEALVKFNPESDASDLNENDDEMGRTTNGSTHIQLKTFS